MLYVGYTVDLFSQFVLASTTFVRLAYLNKMFMLSIDNFLEQKVKLYGVPGLSSLRIVKKVSKENVFVPTDFYHMYTLM